MEYHFLARDNIRSRVQESDLTPDVIYKHFMNCTDECIYIVEDKKLIGIVTPGDLYRFYVSDGENGYLNNEFTSIDEIDFAKAKDVFKRIKTIHEVPVIKDNVFIGIVKSGEQKPSEEWINIRNGFLSYHFGKLEWRKKEIADFLEHTQANIYVYYGFDEKKLKWCDSDWEIYNKKKHHPNGAVGLDEMSECERKAFFGSNCSEEYIEAFIKEYRMLRAVTCNGMPRICDISGRYYNVVNGKRKLSSSSNVGRCIRRICFIGPCIIFGAYVRDDQTIENYLQEKVNHIVPADYEVLNCGMMGPVHFYKLFTEEFSKGDMIVYFAEDDCDYFLWKKASLKYKNVIIGSDLAEAYNGIENPADNILNSLRHCNYVINMRIADIIYKDIRVELSTQINCKDPGKGEKETRTAIQNYYIPWDIVQYYRKYIEEHMSRPSLGENVGAIVMNCNPFTKGHRHLVEYAASKVDRLFVFVVEEDKSDFAFADRFQMVKMGTCDLDNVYVLPSGKYIISKETFSQYFDKDSVTEVKDMDYDLHIFGDVVAKEFGIKTRFVGEEPFDIVTSKYNETMKHLLPSKGVEVVEIPRLKNEEQEVISASLVRNCLKEKKYDKLNALLPQSTLDILGLSEEGEQDDESGKYVSLSGLKDRVEG